MNEYPDELRALLDLAREAHDPTDPEARTRVRHAVATSLLASGAASTSVFPQAASNTQTLGAAFKGSKVGFSLFGGKLGTVALSALTVAGLTFGAYQYMGAGKQAVPHAPAVSAPAVVAPAHVEAQPEAAREPVVAPEPMIEEPVQVARREEPVHKAHKARANAASLQAEMALLREASDALARSDEAGALERLREYGRQFPDGSLREERDGLRAIAECTRDDAPNGASAKHFLRQYPSSLLAGRVSKACAER